MSNGASNSSTLTNIDDYYIDSGAYKCSNGGSWTHAVVAGFYGSTIHYTSYSDCFLNFAFSDTAISVFGDYNVDHGVVDNIVVLSEGGFLYGFDKAWT
ncbi:hypothetical protein T439DRAFT_354127 [Meredithblackwellia eburnea MCA 4105]